MSVPTCWSDEDRSELLEISEDGLGVKFRGQSWAFRKLRLRQTLNASGSATMTRAEQDAAAVRTRVPLLPDVDIFYFEMMIEHDGGNAYMGALSWRPSCEAAHAQRPAALRHRVLGARSST